MQVRIPSFVTFLCEYVNSLLSEKSSLDFAVRIIAATECMVAWILAGQWIFHEPECLSLVFKTIGVHMMKADRVDDNLLTVAKPQTPKPFKKNFVAPLQGSTRQKKKGGLTILPKAATLLKDLSESC